MQPMRVTVLDLGKTLLVVAYVPIGLTLGIIDRWIRGTKDVSFTTDVLLTLARCTSDLPLSIKRLAVARLNIDAILSSPRYRSVSQQLCQHVDRDDFEGYWICQGSLNEPTHPSKCDIVFYYIHGGGYVLGHPLMSVVHLLRVSELLSLEGLSVGIFSLRYGLAPENTFPKPFEQGLAAYQYLLQELHIEPAKIVLSGESAGGHLALALLHKLAKDRQDLPKPGGAALIFPWVDLSNSGASFIRNEKKDILSRHELNRAVRRVCGEAGPAAFADVFDFSAPKPKGYWQSVLPRKTWVTVGSHDRFVDSIEDFFEHARDDGSDIKLDIHQGKPHGWVSIMDALTRKQFLRLGPQEDPKALMKGARLIADALIKLVDMPKI